MKVLWLCNLIVPFLQRELGEKEVNSGGWIEYTLDKMLEMNKCEIAYCAPFDTSQNYIKRDCGGLVFYGYSRKKVREEKYDRCEMKKFQDIINDYKPDIVHIFGTEFSHTLAMVNACSNKTCIIIQIQGIISVCAEHYFDFMSLRTILSFTFRDLLRFDNIYLQKKKFFQRGIYERKALQKISYVMGRTDWDRAWTFAINPEIKYFKCQENLRKGFYTAAKWRESKCKQYTIFMSQGNYSIKGMHVAIRAMRIVCKCFPQAKLFIAGEDIYNTNKMGDMVRKNSYAKYINRLIKKYEIQKNVEFIGEQKENQMIKCFQSANVFILPSLVENSPNSLGEAMMIGTPCIAAFVGGVVNYIQHGIDGYIFPAGDDAMLAFYILQLFQNPNIAEQISECEISKAIEIYNVNSNVNELMNIYNEVLKQNE